MRRSIVALALCAVASHALAQSGSVRTNTPLPQFGLGARVRVAIGNSGQEYVGTLVRFDSAGMLISRPNRGELALPLPEVRSVWVSGGQHSLWLKGALIGAVVGGLLGALEGADCSDVCVFLSNSDVAVLGVSLGAMTGASIGRYIRRDRWTPVALPPLSATSR